MNTVGDWAGSMSPGGRGSRRRWVIALVALLVFVGVVGTAAADTVILIVGIFFGMMLLGEGLRTSTRFVGERDQEDALDERDMAIRGAAHVTAMKLLAVVVLVSLAGMYLLLSHVDRVTTDDGIRSTDTGAFVSPWAMLYLAGWLLFWVRTLPTLVLAWNEPEPIAPEPAEGLLRRALSEPARDGMLIGAIAVSTALVTAFPDVDFYLMLALIGLPWAMGALLVQLDLRAAQRPTSELGASHE